MASISDGDAYWVIGGTGWRTGRSLSMARAAGRRQGAAGQLADDDREGGGADGRPARRAGQVEQGRRGEEVEQQGQRQRGPPGPGQRHGRDDQAGRRDQQGRVAGDGGDHGGGAPVPGGAAPVPGGGGPTAPVAGGWVPVAGDSAAATGETAAELAEAALSARTSSVSSLISRPRKKLSAVRMAATAASCPSSVKLGATAVRRMSAASWNSRPSTRKRPRSSRSRANGSMPSRRKATSTNRANAITAPTKIMAAPAASTTCTRTLTTSSRLCAPKPSARVIVAPYPALAWPNPARKIAVMETGDRR